MKDEQFKDLMGAVRQSVDYVKDKPVKNLRVHRIAVPDQVDVRKIRKKLRMTRETFAETFGFSVSGVSKWESGERVPEGPARVLLHMIGKDAAAVLQLAGR